MAVSRIPSLNWLRVFEAAARTGSFARAAELLHMSPPAVSQQVRALEGHLGQPLFERGPRSVSLTEAGHAFLPTVTRALTSMETAADNLFSRAGHHPLTIQSVTLFAVGWLIPRLSGFRASFPDVQLNLTSEVVAEDPPRPGTDLRITFGLPGDQAGNADLLFGERIYPVARPEIAQTISQGADFARWPLVEISTHRANWSSLLPPSAPSPRFLFCDTTVAAFALAEAGDAIALARSPASDTLEARHGLVRCPVRLQTTGSHNYYLSYPVLAGLSPAAIAFRNWLLGEIEATRPVGTP
ncbi:MAG: LysR family transcriptional regulator [Pseudomonadota bacterium]